MGFIKDLKLSGLPEKVKNEFMEIYKGIQEIYNTMSTPESEEIILGETNGIPATQEYFSACPFGEAVKKYPR